MSAPTWQSYRLFEFDEMVSSAMRAPAEIVALVGPLRRETTERSMLPYWINMCRIIHRWEQVNVDELIDIGGES